MSQLWAGKLSHEKELARSSKTSKGAAHETAGALVVMLLDVATTT